MIFFLLDTRVLIGLAVCFITELDVLRSHRSRKQTKRGLRIFSSEFTFQMTAPHPYQLTNQLLPVHVARKNEFIPKARLDLCLLITPSAFGLIFVSEFFNFFFPETSTKCSGSFTREALVCIPTF